jgi:DnaJ-class molecular chaperone
MGQKGKHGDLHVKILIKPNPFLSRVGNNIFSKKYITLGDAINGISLEIQTVK